MGILFEIVVQQLAEKGEEAWKEETAGIGEAQVNGSNKSRAEEIVQEQTTEQSVC
jgi:hypothetical protein